MADEFRLVLRMHTPIIMPTVTPRLDVLLHEAMCRLNQNWEGAHRLPLENEAGANVYCASQLILGSTPDRPLSASSERLVSTVFRQDLYLAGKVKKRFGSTFPDGNRLTPHSAISTPFAIFYGVGDGQACAELLGMLSGIGREHARHYGAFNVERLERDTSSRWRLRPWPIGHPNAWETSAEPYVEDKQSLRPKEKPVGVMRPPRMIREVMHASR